MNAPRNLRCSGVLNLPVPMLPKVLLPLAAVLAVVLSAPAHAQDVPSKRVLYNDGPTNRYLVDGQWLLRLDPGNAGVSQGFHKQTSTEGWSATEVPGSWNGKETSNEAMRGGVAWYRKDFRLPSSSSRYDWTIRFESISYRSRAWLNGKPLGSSRGAHLPVAYRIPRSALKRTGTNRLVVRTENVRKRSDLPPSGQTRTAVPTGGWWNYGGLLREVYLKRVDRVDFNTVQVLPDLPCRTCAATVNFRVTVRNFADSAQRVALTGRFGDRTVRFRRASVGAKRFRTFTASVRIGDPKLWSPRSPSLYDVRLDLRAGDRRVSTYKLRSGIRSVKVSGGRLTLNGLPVNLRGVGLHEDDPEKGFALDNAARERIISDARDVGATMLRAHYPLHPYTHERADELGLLVWSEIPMYAIKTEFLKSEIVRKTGANELRDNILANGNHPSIVTWSVGNELSARPGPVQGDYLRRASRQAKALDPTRPVSYAVAGYPAAGCQTEYAPIDILGINEYFGWYPGPNGQIADRTLLSEYLDGVRACYPDKALMITEFGAEANRSGSVEEKGTYEHQQDFVNYHLGVYATKPWLSGALYWTLKEFKIRPEWDGGNPRPSPLPLHQKAVIAYDGTRKPAFADLQRLFRSVDQYPGDSARTRGRD
jgi:beta-glucuronidase